MPFLLYKSCVQTSLFLVVSILAYYYKWCEGLRVFFHLCYSLLSTGGETLHTAPMLKRWASSLSPKLFLVKVKNTWAQSYQQKDSQNSDKIWKSCMDFRIFLRYSLFLLVYIKFNLLTLRKNKNNNLIIVSIILGILEYK